MFFGFGEKPAPEAAPEAPVEQKPQMEELTTAAPTETATEPIAPTLEAVKTEGADIPADTTTTGPEVGVVSPTLEAVKTEETESAKENPTSDEKPTLEAMKNE